MKSVSGKRTHESTNECANCNYCEVVVMKYRSPLREFACSVGQYSSASMIVITRWVIVGSAGPSEW
jgi:hypothetical protein